MKLDKRYPVVSIITVCLNSRKYLDDAIKSVSGQTYPNIEYLIIDGGSTDGSVEIFNKYKNRIDRLIVEKDKGIFDAMNKGIGLAGGEIIYFLNSDDRLYDNKVIERVAPLFTGDKNPDFVYGNIEVVNPVNGTSYIERYPRKITRKLFIRKTIGHPATFFSSFCFKKVGLFDEKYKIAADYEWFLRALYLNKLKALHIEKNISIFRLGGISTNRKYRDLYFSERRAIQKKYFNGFELMCSGILEFISKNLHA